MTWSAGNTWLRRVVEAANHLLDLDHYCRKDPIVPAAFYVAPPPWQAPTVERGTTGAAVVTGQEVLSWRTPDHCSTLQTELVAIQHGPWPTPAHRRGEMVVVHSDSRSALQHTAGQDDGQTLLPPTAPAATPGDGGVIAAGRLVCQSPPPTAHCFPPASFPGQTRAKLHRPRLGYRTPGGAEGAILRVCSVTTVANLARHPLRHYLLSCPATAQLRQQIGGPEDDEDRAALVLRRALEDLPRLLVVVRSAPPPR
ncbi:hypothetical protein GWK47_019799 [Chionoecetes opilio]|uniref:Uncharacterized protein n=1 Tax=Chionoecetes opilio TaxID=41210 RepID=A0A8J4XYP7_CHIOP|nr:hypothetical protein GWK47_019799 [Chionoecetes opilio]